MSGLECTEVSCISGGEVDGNQLGPEIDVSEIDESDRTRLVEILTPYCRRFKLNLNEILEGRFTRLKPFSSRPYGKLYAY